MTRAGQDHSRRKIGPGRDVPAGHPADTDGLTGAADAGLLSSDSNTSAPMTSAVAPETGHETLHVALQAAPGGLAFTSHSNHGTSRHTTSHSTPSGPVDGSPPAEVRIERLVEEHYAELYRYAFRLTGNATDAADTTQQTFLNAQRHLESIRDPAKVRGWLYSILRNTFLKLRRKKTAAPASNLEINLDHINDPAFDAARPIPEFDAEDLQRAITELPDEFRTVVLMFYFEECSYREIARALEIPAGTVMSRLSRAKGHLRKRLGRTK